MYIKSYLQKLSDTNLVFLGLPPDQRAVEGLVLVLQVEGVVDRHHGSLRHRRLALDPSLLRSLENPAVPGGCDVRHALVQAIEACR